MPAARDALDKYVKASGIQHTFQEQYVEVSIERGTRIANAYDEMAQAAAERPRRGSCCADNQPCRGFVRAREVGA